MHSDDEDIRSEEVARWLIDNAPESWIAWCHKYEMRFDPERDEFIDLREWGFGLAGQDRGLSDQDEYLPTGEEMTDRLNAMIAPDPDAWKEASPLG